ncbi:aromatic amino acid hydroxylase [Aquisalibacillus elongatus]|uniref:Phenylalanine-4-hydroxylase n=1 Tax=Aquisalibacillus elongatus TaxID=485577 RepID=A0A3N5B4V1_9BACI|nr:aromatic amino acid hydroxylase [Aquisalibacillus elongatus]RPF50580.1 phenylalanine-4-hydroxylase [Aquisalibacillus elongatus]
MTIAIQENQKVPKHLRQYTAEQHYGAYTPINHAVWRYVMRQNHHTLKNLAHEAYTDGLRKSGITIEKIPNVDDMNKALAPFGWGAATIDGFIPGVAFFEFQGNGVLPIATEIRKLENIQYTPAPDIIHEAAGHAPILCDKKYSEYVKLFGEIGKKAIATKEEHDHFDAVRHYSNLLEKGDATQEEIKKAEENLEEKEQAIKGVSEAEKIGRLYWWTVEFGLIGTVNQPRIYGAGLLSSVAEGGNILSPDVEKRPYDVQEMVETSFDITKPQPQLFVCESFDQLIDGLKEFAQEMAFMKGGTESLDKAIQSENTATAVFSSGLQVTGVFSTRRTDEDGNLTYIKTNGETNLAVNDTELAGHGTDHHADGFSSPVGKLKGMIKPLEDLTDEELVSQGILIEKLTSLVFESGLEVKGLIKDIVRKNGKVVLITFDQCRVIQGDDILFEPEWGVFDMAVGAEIVSVFAGAADGEAYHPTVKEDKEPEKILEELSPIEQLYQDVRDVREGRIKNSEAVLRRVASELNDVSPNDWLLRIEILEILLDQQMATDLLKELNTELNRVQSLNEEWHTLIERGRKVAKSASLISD